MCLYGEHSIIDSENYLLLNNSESISLSDIADSVYISHPSFVSFRFKINCNDEIKKYPFLRGGFDDCNENRYLQSLRGDCQDIYNIIQLTEKVSPLSLTNCRATTSGPNSLTLRCNDLIPYYKLLSDDFYIKTPLGRYSPSTIIRKGIYEYEFLFNKDIFNSTLEYLSLNTISTPSSLDALGDFIKGDDSIYLINQLSTTIKKVSISSYINNTLVLIITFSAPILRYDSNDFNVYINNLVYPSLGHESYSEGPMILTINDLSHLDTDKDRILVKTSGVIYPYTIDFKRLPVEDLIGKEANHFISLSGTLEDNVEEQVLKLSLEFNKEPSNYTGSVNSTLLVTNKLITLSIENLGLLRIYGNNFVPNFHGLTYPVNITIYDNSLNLSITTSQGDFFAVNSQNISYIDFKPDSQLQSLDETFVLSSFEAPIKFTLPTSIIIYPDDEGASFSLLGKTIALPVTIIVNRSKRYRYYGSSLNPTTFLNDLYIISDDSDNTYDDVDIDLINIMARNLYVNLPDEYSLKIESSTFNLVKTY